MPNLYSAADAARKLGGISSRRIRAIAERDGIGKLTSAGWVFTEQDIEQLRNRNKRPGRPRTKGTEE